MEYTERLEARIDPTRKALLQRAAELRFQSMSEFVISAAVSRAERVIEEENCWKLTPEQSETFAQALLADSEPNEALKEAFKRYETSGFGG